MGGGEAHAAGRVVHHGDEIGLAAADGFGDGHRDIVGRLDDQHVERVVERERTVDGEARLARRLVEGIARNGDRGIERDGAELQLLEGHIGGHQLGERRRMPGLARILGEQHFERCAIDHQHRIGPARHDRAERDDEGKDDAAQNDHGGTTPGLAGNGLLLARPSHDLKKTLRLLTGM